MRRIGLFFALWLTGQAALAQRPPSPAQTRGPLPLPLVDRQVAVDGSRRLHIRCGGAGTPTVVLNAGLGGDADSWRGVQHQIAQSTRVCSWDRPGFGSSDESGASQDAAYTTSQLEKLLSAADVRPPYVIVGHSYGGYESVLFAHRNEKATRALVLLDPTYPHLDRIFLQAAPSIGRLYSDYLKGRIAVGRACLAAAAKEGCAGPPDKDPARRAAFLRSRLSIYESWQASAVQVGAVKALGRLPLFVLTAGVHSPTDGADPADEPKAEAAWNGMHQRYAKLSTVGVHRRVPGAGHMIHDDRPDIVVATIEEAIAVAREGAGPRGR
ncbi:alpha/beta fold hydrolase [Sphingomonas sp. M1-B02]|uniref:alpha/beta fold hydrolase n=1 Tax=Sphingomonas sp. M1-B02 TaxID=3114300 RepID=UPI002240BD2A|nr:alpha/beta hydrolase [Sphingomonas sp. S6-11]UZK67797.1 alpha/beta hydrolase [Sphingomonas sp. S6-11]